MSARPIRVGHIDLSFHDASAREVEAILVDEGHAVERSAAPHEEMFARLGRGEVDVLVSAWRSGFTRRWSSRRSTRTASGATPTTTRIRCCGAK